jgi:hypothetical protein
MLLTLCRYQKAVALFFYILFYGELLTTSYQAKAAAYVPYSYRLPSNRPSDHRELIDATKFGKPSMNNFGGEQQSENRKALISISGANSLKKFDGPGPTQPEMQAFTSANTKDMVDLFTGDFTYNIPLLDVGGYPVNISYRGGISMDQEASWVGLGWNINPGTITRNMRGLPDDFDGADSIKKVTSIKENKTIGVTGGASFELTGLHMGAGASLGVFHNNYKGWGLETSLNASINAGIGASGALSGGLSLTNNSQEGLTLTPSISVSLTQKETAEKSSLGGSFSTALPYNSRAGLKGLQLSAGIRQTNSTYIESRNKDGDVSITKVDNSASTAFSSSIAFASPAGTPSITMPFTSRQFSFTAKLGLEATVAHPNFFISGYVSKQQIDPQDTLLSLPAFGYLYAQDGDKTKNPLQDFNREKELIYRDRPAIPHIALPFYTYDAFSISGEGTGGMFRAYRSDIGYIHDHFIRTKDASTNGSVDVGIGDLVHAGIDVNLSSSFTQNSAWLDQNSMRNLVNFRNSDTLFEASYFRNPGEKAINSTQFYNAIGGDDVVTVGLSQAGSSSSVIQATNYLNSYKGSQKINSKPLTYTNAVKQTRDKRAEVISYLTAQEADQAALSKYIENYTPNQFNLENCTSNLAPSEGLNGLLGLYWPNLNFSSTPYSSIDDSINFNWATGHPNFITKAPLSQFPSDKFVIIWNGRIKAPVTGQYWFTATHDDGVRIWLNDTLVLEKWRDGAAHPDSVKVNLVAGQFYKLNLMFKENGGFASINFKWSYPGQTTTIVPYSNLFMPLVDTIPVNSNLTLERRVNNFRLKNHISEIDVLNPDGRKYVYGIPVYNFTQKEATFAVNGSQKGNISTGLVKYTNGLDNSTNNQNGQDHYYTSEVIPSYAHSFLLTGILSPDYLDLTGNGISDDDLGDAIKFKYSKVNGQRNPFKWRAPYVKDSVTLNEGFKTDSRDDKGSYTYGEKENWYMHSIESKTMIATFVTGSRLDMLTIDEAGNKKNDSSAKLLKAINLYSKAELIKNPSAKPIKTVHFEYSYELCKGINVPVSDSGKLTLKRIWFTYNGNKKDSLNPYVFNYNTKNPTYNLKSYDRWGNYKDPLQNPGSTTGNLITNAEYPYGLQDSLMAAQNAAAWALDSIMLPSGGALKMTYESDDYAYIQARRAMSLFKMAGLGSAPGLSSPVPKLYTGSGDNLYVYIKVPTAVSSKQDVYQKYLTGIGKMYFRFFVQMPTDKWGKGSEYISCYSDLDTAGGNGYGIVASNPNMIWVKITGISLKGDGPGTYSPLAKAAIQYLRLNLPSKAYPGSQVGDNMDLGDAVQMIMSMADNIVGAFTSFDSKARTSGWAVQIDTSRSFARLNSPTYQKYGGGYRVKKIILYDNWAKMNPGGGRTMAFGQEYSYKTTKSINGINQLISSGVASWEPGIGGEENPYRLPIEYTEEMSALGPVSMGYSEEPLGESLFPSPQVGYSNVRVRTINYKNIRSANGYEETGFYTAYDFPTKTDRTPLDGDNKKRFKPSLANFLRINAKYYLTMSQGFKVELNDMHGKLRYQASYSETDPQNPVTYTENVYKVDDPLAEQKHLSNIVSVVSKDGMIDTAAVIGKDAELMMDMREQQSVTSGNNISVNTDMFALPFIPPFFLIPSFLSLGQRQETRFRSVATTKVIQRYGIVDSVIHIDKGSKISTKDLLYDAETGNVVLTRSQNEFNDPVFSFNYPAHWAYDGMGPAYKNISAVASHVNISNGKLVSGLKVPVQDVFSAGDEILVNGKQVTGAPGTCSPIATFAGSTRIWAYDSSVYGVGAPCIYFIDAFGKPYSGADVNLKIIKSGRRNLGGQTGKLSCLVNPIVYDGALSKYKLAIDSTKKIVATDAVEFKQSWQIEERKFKLTSVKYTDSLPANCSGGGTNCNCTCLKSLFDYLITSKRLFIRSYEGITVSQIVSNANAAGYPVAISDCPILQNNATKLFYAQTLDSVSNRYIAQIGNCSVNIASLDNGPINFYSLASMPVCSGDGSSQFMTKGFTYHIYAPANISMSNIYHNINNSDSSRYSAPTGRYNDTSSDKLMVANLTTAYEAVSINGMMRFDSLMNYVDSGSAAGGSLVNVSLNLHAYPGGFYPPTYSNAHSSQSISHGEVWWPDSSNWNLTTAASTLNSFFSVAPLPTLYVNSPFQDTSIDVSNIWGAAPSAGLTLLSRFYGGTPGLVYSTFCGVKYADPAKRPYLDLKFRVGGDSTPLAKLNILNCEYKDTIVSNSCNSAITDTIINPYTTGILGNWRQYKNYTYYGQRAETDPSLSTNIRTAGVIPNFVPFWIFQNAQLVAQTDTTKWVWNTQSTMFNHKGMEIENKDPLGRYNTGLYGYNSTLPTAVVQNAQFREAAFDGFEDYGFMTRVCDTTCPVAGHFDFTPYAYKITTSQKHTGKSSLQVSAGTQVALSFPIATVSQDTMSAKLAVVTASDACNALVVSLKSIKANSSFIEPTFSPFAGRQMLISAWVKEAQDCNCNTYTNNSITVFAGGTSAYSINFYPSGSIVEGWQRYEGVFSIPIADTSVTFSLNATGAANVYFDDIRIIPFNANMKSFVYNPGNLRLMAELDENNYATFYEYDDDGTLIRVKKETERGIQTIKETRSALFKK